MHFCLQDYFSISLFAKQQRSNWVEQCRQYKRTKFIIQYKQRIQCKWTSNTIQNNTNEEIIQYKEYNTNEQKTLQYKEYNTKQYNTNE